MSEFLLRQVSRSAEDQAFLDEMLYEAATWRPTPARPSLESVLERPEIALYVEGWGRPGDCGFVAEEGGLPIGAAWYRLFTPEMPGYGFLSIDIPELTIAVKGEARDRGAGSLLLHALLRHAQAAGFSSISLSVERDNPALRLYERFGFSPIGQAGNAWTMARSFSDRPFPP